MEAVRDFFSSVEIYGKDYPHYERAFFIPGAEDRVGREGTQYLNFSVGSLGWFFPLYSIDEKTRKDVLSS